MDELDLTDAEKKATYEEIKAYVLEHTGLKVSNLLKRAMIACENSGHDIAHDFPEVRKIVEAGVTKKRFWIMN